MTPLPAALHVAALEYGAPASILVDDEQHIVHLSPSAGRFILHSAGPVSTALPDVVRPELRLDLRMGLSRALDEGEPTVTLPVAVAFDQGRRQVCMQVIPIANEAQETARALVFFLDGGPILGSDDPELTDARTDEVRRLYAELKAAQEALVVSRGGHEASIQELRAANEELQSINEEYRSTAEELETSKEELQSINEELHTVNAELKSKLETISATHNDLQNLTAATEIGTLFLDRDLRIRMFTPAVSDLFNITSRDIGRAITDFTNQLDYDRIEVDTQKVLRDLVPIEHEVHSRNGQSYFMRLRPYRTVDDRIDGTVVTLVDVTARAQTEAALRNSELKFRTLAETAPAFIWLNDDTGGNTFVNQPFVQFTGRTPEQIAGEGWRGLVHPDHEERYATEYMKAVGARDAWQDRNQLRRADGAWRWVDNYAQPLFGADGRYLGHVGVSIDIDDSVKAEAVLRQSEERQTFLLKLSDALRPLHDPDEIQFVAAQALGRHLGASRVAYAENREKDDTFVVSRNYVDGAPEVLGVHSYEDYGSDIKSELQDRRNRVQPDVAHDERLTAAQKQRLADAGVGASLNTPLVKDGQFVAFLSLNYRTAHDFTIVEIDLVAEVAERTWSAVERARAEVALHETEERLQQFGEASQDVLWIRDAGTLQWEYLTPAFETIYGLSCEAALRGDNMTGWLELIVPEDREHAAASLSRVHDGEWVTFEFRIRRPVDGGVRWMRNTDFPIQDASGKVVRIGGIGHDVTTLKEAEVALAAAETRQRALLEGIPQLVWRAVDSGEWTWASPQWTGFTGQPEVESHDFGWLDVVHPDDREPALELWKGAIERGEFQAEYRILHLEDGRHRWMQSRATPVRDEQGGIVEWLGTSTDIEDLRSLQARQQVLVTELQHRTFNLMGVVRSTADATMRSSETLDQFQDNFRDRIDALARVQRLLSRLKEGDRITFDELIRGELNAAGALQPGDGRVTLEGPDDVALRSGTVQIFAMAIHELTTNALKYGALKQPGAHLDVRWRIGADGDDRPMLHVDWQEKGVVMPPPGEQPSGTGQGRTLIEKALPYQLGAQVSYVLAEDGVRCSISLPASWQSTVEGADAAQVPDTHDLL